MGADEVYSILCKADPKISAAEAKQIFDSCDRDGDGKINFDELRDYLHPVSANENTAYRKVMRDGFSIKSPGPLDYDAWQGMSNYSFWPFAAVNKQRQHHCGMSLAVWTRRATRGLAGV